MLSLRRGTVSSTDPLVVLVDDDERPAWADDGMVGAIETGDEVIVNVGAVELGLGSGGFDIVHANLTRGLEGELTGDDHVMKLNYTSLQHPVDPVEAGDEHAEPIPVAVVSLHGQLAPLCWSLQRAHPGLRVGFVQTPGAALPGGLSRDVAELRDRGMLAGHITAGPCHGGEFEAITVAGAVHAASAKLGWQLAIAGPGPGILGSATRLGHGGMAALDTLHAAAALGFPAVCVPRMSSTDPRPRHRGLSHHTAAVLELLLCGVRVIAPDPAGEWPEPEGSEAASPADALEQLRSACGERHEAVEASADFEGYLESGLPSSTMGRQLAEDPLFFASPLAAGAAIGGDPPDG